MSAAPTSPSCEFVRRFRHDKKLWSGRFVLTTHKGGDAVLWRMPDRV